MLCPTSGQWYPFQHTFAHWLCKVRYLWGATNSTWSDIFIESTLMRYGQSKGDLTGITLNNILPLCSSFMWNTDAASVNVKNALQRTVD